LIYFVLPDENVIPSRTSTKFRAVIRQFEWQLIATNSRGYFLSYETHLDTLFPNPVYWRAITTRATFFRWSTAFRKAGKAADFHINLSD